MEWVKVSSDEAIQLQQKRGAEILCLFDTGEYAFINDQWPFAECTHIMEILKPEEDET